MSMEVKITPSALRSKLQKRESILGQEGIEAYSVPRLSENGEMKQEMGKLESSGRSAPHIQSPSTAACSIFS